LTKGDLVNDRPAVTLRPLTQHDVAALEAARTREADPFNWAGYEDAGRLADTLAKRLTLREDGGLLAVVDHQGSLVGDVSWRRLRTGPAADSWCWNIGIALLPDQRGKGYGAQAQRLLASYLFEQTTTQRVEADTDVENIAEQRALEKAGFTREGVLRQAQWRAGRWHDMVSYSILRGEIQ
jgi:aminoglycoside 6'-N-acetyltransferase